MRLVHAVVGVPDGGIEKGGNGFVYWSSLRARRPRPAKRGVVVPCLLRVTQSTRPRSHKPGSQQEGRQCLSPIKHRCPDWSTFVPAGVIGYIDHDEMIQACNRYDYDGEKEVRKQQIPIANAYHYYYKETYPRSSFSAFVSTTPVPRDCRRWRKPLIDRPVALSSQDASDGE